MASCTRRARAYDAALFLCAALPKGPAQLLVLVLIIVPFVVVIQGYRRLKQHAEEALRLDEITHAPKPALRLALGLGFILK